MGERTGAGGGRSGRKGVSSSYPLAREIVDTIRQQIGPVAAFKTALVVKRLPQTRSGKILRSTMKRIADSQAYTAPAMIDDPAILDEITAALKGARYAKGQP